MDKISSLAFTSVISICAFSKVIEKETISFAKYEEERPFI